ncbi:MAG: Rho termination factor N-terminal domain-containing protein [Acidiferrobacterales bacterium]|nr:Rho termination factor N-terminal domain-containing protein [Acidiferrobacterales bacterium]
MEDKSVKTLREMARDLGITGYSKLRKDELISAIKAAQKPKRAATQSKAGSKPGSGKAKNVAKAKPAKKAASAGSKPDKTTTVPVAANEEQRIENAKYATGPTGVAARESQYPPDLGEDIDHLPSLSEPRLALLMQKPGVLLASWNLEPGHCARQPGLRLRLGVLADRRFNVSQEVEVSRDQGSYYFHVEPSWPLSEIYLQLGAYEAGGHFAIAIRRGIVRLPRLLALTALGVNWALEEAEFESVAAQSGPLGRVPRRVVAIAPSSPGGGFTSGGLARRE